MKIKREFGLIVVLVIFNVLCALKEPNYVSPRNIESILLWMPLLLVAALGQFPVIVARGIDISVGSVVGLSAITTGVLLKSHPDLSLPMLFAIGASVGLALGALNGLLITFGKIPAVVATIGTLTLYRGLTFMISGGDQIDASYIPDKLTALANSGITIKEITISWLLVIGICFALLAAFSTKFAQFYRNVFAYGSNPDAAYLRGISPNAVQMFCYGVSGVMGGIAGIMFLSRFGNASPSSAGAGVELVVIASVAIGGVKITGGSGSILGVFLGCVLLSCINVALTALKFNADWQMLIYGVTILIALMIDALSTQRRRAKA